MSRIRRLRNRRPESPEESGGATEQVETATADVTEAADDAEVTETAETVEAAAPEAAAPEETVEEAAEATDSAEAPTSEPAPEPAPEPASEPTGAAEPGVERGPSRLGRWGLVGISAALVVLAGAIGVGGYLAVRANQESKAMARNEAAALHAARDCMTAMWASDAAAMSANEEKIIDCGSDQFRSQALILSGTFVQVYQAANVHSEVSDMRAAVERDNGDGTIDILMALRVKVVNDQEQPKEFGSRWRARMSFVDGRYRISKLDQVTSK